MVIVVIMITYMPLNPSQIDAYGQEVLRNGRRVSATPQWHDDEKRLSGRGPGRSNPMPGPSTRARPHRYDWPIGALLLTTGSLWMLIILGVMLPWYSLLPMAAIVIGGFFMVRALNHGTACVRRDLSHDRCDH
jgi:hypothetical protein